VKILVTGAAGFLGWNVTRELRRLGPRDEIVGLDNLWTGVRRREEFVDRMHVRDVEVGTLLWEGAFDEVWHLASPASPRHYQSRPLDTIAANVDGLRCCLEYVRPGGTLFFASTSEVYGDPLVSPQPETYWGHVNCCGVRACYDESKRLCETILRDVVRVGTPVQPKIARLFNVYGPGTLENDGRAVSNFVCQGLRGQPITVMGDGLQTRCFTYVDDVVRALVRLVRHTGDFVGPVNVGTDVETTVLRIAQEVQRRTGGRSEVVHVAAAEDDPRQRLPDLRLCREVLEWEATTTWEVGLERTILHFRKELRL
jgi:nucleoside-diphosphate-sugar epimerase